MSVMPNQPPLVVFRGLTTTIQVYYMCERVEGVRWGVIGCEGVLDGVIGGGERVL